jgi:hypothetical protein
MREQNEMLVEGSFYPRRQPIELRPLSWEHNDKVVSFPVRNLRGVKFLKNRQSVWLEIEKVSTNRP